MAAARAVSPRRRSQDRVEKLAARREISIDIGLGMSD
jgi:hypothetical protein